MSKITSSFEYIHTKYSRKDIARFGQMHFTVTMGRHDGVLDVLEILGYWGTEQAERAFLRIERELLKYHFQCSA
jgi:hypothetical protein